jgi:hypothetical protein
MFRKLKEPTVSVVLLIIALLLAVAGCGSTVKPSTTPVPQAVTPTPPAERETRGAKIAKAEETSRENERHDAEIIEQATLTPTKTPKVGPPKPAEERVEGETIPEEMAKGEKHARESAEYSAYLLAQKTLEEETRREKGTQEQISKQELHDREVKEQEQRETPPEHIGP